MRGPGGQWIHGGQDDRRGQLVSHILIRASAAGQSTDVSQTVDHHGQVYTPERAAIHNEIVNAVMKRAQSIPNDGKAIFGGGLPGAGKTTALQSLPDVDTSKYLAVAPDDFKEELAKRGMVPKVHGLTPMEATPLVSEEAHHIANMVAARAQAQHKNIIIDLTMMPEDKAEERIARLHKDGYKVHGVYVDVPIEVSIERAQYRYRKGAKEFMQGKGLGGRYVPPADILSKWGTADPHISQNSLYFEKLKTEFDQWEKLDNSVFGQVPKMIASSKAAV